MKKIQLAQLNYMLQTRENLVLSILFLLCILLFFIRSYLADNVYIQTFGYLQTQKQVQQLNIKNNQLKITLLKIESYTNMAQQAKREGYIQAVFITP